MGHDMSKKILLSIALLSFSLSACFSGQPAVSTPQPQPTLSQIGGGDYDYRAIDQHALNAPTDLRQRPAQLAQYLIKPARHQREKARAIFRWITANIDYDAYNYFRGGSSPNSTQDVLGSGKAVCDGYANLFKQLADHAGLETVMISGLTKGFSYLTRGRLGAVDHAWNAVKIDGQWQLLDSTWGAGHLNNKTKRFVQNFKPYYFLTPASSFIFDHFPDDKRWQLLPRPKSKSEFEQLAYLRPAFFQSGLQLVSHTQESLDTKGALSIVIRVPKDNYLSAKLIQGEKALPRSQVKLERKGELYYITPTFPHNGDYRLRIFTKRGLKAQYFNWALDYKIRKY